MMNEKQRSHVSKFLSLVLRHDPDKIGIELDQAGWTKTGILINKMKSNGYPTFTFEDLKEVVTTNEKKRFEFGQGERTIRASQGHSVDIDPGYTAIEPPDQLYHGTSTIVVDNILRSGINKGTRTHVHLSDNDKTAVSVGARHGKPCVLIINAKQMHEDGHKFYLSTNKVWLCDFIPVQYIDHNIQYTS